MKDYKIDCYDGFSVLDGELIMFLSKTRDISRKFYETLKEERGKEYADEVIDEMLIPPDYMLTLNFENKSISALARYFGPDSIKTSLDLTFSPDEEKQIFEQAEEFCQKEFGMTCREFIDSDREEYCPEYHPHDDFER